MLLRIDDMRADRRAAEFWPRWLQALGTLLALTGSTALWYAPIAAYLHAGFGAGAPRCRLVMRCCPRGARAVASDRASVRTACLELHRDRLFAWQHARAVCSNPGRNALEALPDPALVAGTRRGRRNAVHRDTSAEIPRRHAEGTGCPCSTAGRISRAGAKATGLDLTLAGRMAGRRALPSIREAQQQLDLDGVQRGADRRGRGARLDLAGAWLLDDLTRELTAESIAGAVHGAEPQTRCSWCAARSYADARHQAQRRCATTSTTIRWSGWAARRSSACRRRKDGLDVRGPCAVVSRCGR